MAEPPPHRLAPGVAMGVLGPLTVARDGQEVAVPRGRESALLEWLVLHRRAGASVDATATALWPGTARAEARQALRGCRSRLRRRLAGTDEGGIVAAAGDRFTLDLGALRIDADDFERDRRRAHLAVAEGRLPAALGLLEHGLGLWRGEAYRWLADTGAGLAEAVRLDELRTDAEETRSALRACTGHDAEAVAELAAVVELDPLRERAWRLLMAALAVGGRRGEALRAYQRCRAALAAIGATPAAATVALERRILSDAPIDPVAVLGGDRPGRPSAAPDRADVPADADAVLAAWAEVGHGARTILVATPTGSAAPALRALAAAVADDGGAFVAVPGHRPDDGGPALASLAEALDQAGMGGHDLTAALADWTDRPVSGDPDDLATSRVRHRSVAALAGVLARAAGRGPVCLALYGNASAASPVESVVRAAVESLDDAPVLVVLTRASAGPLVPGSAI